jgi:acyl carrier protein
MVLLNKTQIASTVLEVLKDVQMASGRPMAAMTDDSEPIGDLEGFDSLNGLEASVELERRFGCTFKVNGVFVNDSGKRALHVWEVVDTIAKHLVAGRAA